VLLSALAAAAATPGAVPASAPAKGAELHQQITQAYMMGEWASLDKLLRSATGLSTEQLADVKYVREAVAECRPVWWNACKAAKGKVLIHPSIWGKQFSAIYDPAGKGGMQMQTGPQGTTLTISWAQRDMDSGDVGLYGYTRGDVNCIEVWGHLANAQIWPTIPLPTLAAMSDDDKAQMQKYMGARGEMAMLYYGTPPARRYALHISMAAFYYDKWGKDALAGVRRAVCSGVMQEIVNAPAKFPSIKLPAKLDGEHPETALGQHLKMAFKRTDGWTIREDRSIRLAVRAMAAIPANDKPMWTTQKFTLGDGLVYHLDADQDDRSFRPKRDAWFKEKFGKAGK
jgi:hypothetical protein